MGSGNAISGRLGAGMLQPGDGLADIWGTENAIKELSCGHYGKDGAFRGGLADSGAGVIQLGGGPAVIEARVVQLGGGPANIEPQLAQLRNCLANIGAGVVHSKRAPAGIVAEAIQLGDGPADIGAWYCNYGVVRWTWRQG